MQIPGCLEQTTLGDVLGGLHREQTTGVLQLIERRGAEHHIYLERGDVGHVQSACGLRIGDVLRRQGAISQEKVKQLERLCFSPSLRPLGEALVEAAIVSRSDLQVALRAQQLSRLDFIYLLNSAAIRFRVACPKGATSVRLRAADFLHRRPRKRDRCRTVAGSRVSAEPQGRSAALRALGLRFGARQCDIRQAFRKLAGPHHPDRLTQLEPEERLVRLREFGRLSTAYRQLIAPGD